MGNCCSRFTAAKYDDFARIESTQVVSPPVAFYTRRQPKEGEIDEIAEALNVESFQKNRQLLLRKVEGIELNQKDALLLIRALKTDNEKVEFIKNFSSNFNGLKAEDVSPYIRNYDRMHEIEKILLHQDIHPVP